VRGPLLSGDDLKPARRKMDDTTFQTGLSAGSFGEAYGTGRWPRFLVPHGSAALPKPPRSSIYLLRQ
jgi:hypothetical protein